MKNFEIGTLLKFYGGFCDEDYAVVIETFHVPNIGRIVFWIYEGETGILSLEELSTLTRSGTTEIIAESAPSVAHCELS